jgi:RNA polymerase sigma-70 factor, ECF subfamily
METTGPFERVLAAARAGEGWALAELFRDLHPRVLRYLRTVSPDEAEDLTSDTWLDVVRALERFRGAEADLRALAFSIARTRVAEARDAAARRLLDTERISQVSVTHDDGAHDGEDLEVTLAGLDTESALARVLTLPLDEAEIVLLRVLGALSVAEVARTLEASQRKVRTLQRRALRRLADVSAEERTTS